MNYQGIFPGRPFPVNRPLTEQDYKYRLQQKERLNDVTPYSDLSVIKLNSTYLEIVDKYYGWKGWAAFILSAFFLLFFVGALAFSVATIDFLLEGEFEGVYFGIIFILTMLSISVVSWYLGRFEWAYFTHYPIRLNRKTKTVHVFRKDGSVLSVPWSEVFFTLDQDARFWEIRGHVLGEDGKTVKETFALGTYSTLDGSGPILRAHWEFFRRYMEEGPEAVAQYVKQTLPVDGKRESFRVGYEVLAANLRHPSIIGIILTPISWPIVAVSSIGRWAAMRKSKIPRWPAEIEAVNQVDPNDPYCIDARINPPELR